IAAVDGALAAVDGRARPAPVVHPQLVEQPAQAVGIEHALREVVVQLVPVPAVSGDVSTSVRQKRCGWRRCFTRPATGRCECRTACLCPPPFLPYRESDGGSQAVLDTEERVGAVLTSALLSGKVPLQVRRWTAPENRTSSTNFFSGALMP